MMLVKGKIEVGKYSDGSGPKFEVDWDLSRGNSIWIEQFSDNWIAVDVEDVDALCRAIKRAVKHVCQHSPVKDDGK